MIENYKLFLAFITKNLDSYFEEQSPYIFCKKGCAKCCKNAQFPYSKLEASYLTLGFMRLDEPVKNIVIQNIAKIKRDKQNFQGEKFLYTCPFLTDDVCSVYQYRGIICRTFGLIADSHDDIAKIPFCHKDGLNYSNVMDFEKGKITKEKWQEAGYNVEPHGFNISYEFMTSSKIQKAFNIEFGEKKSMIDWF